MLVLAAMGQGLGFVDPGTIVEVDIPDYIVLDGDTVNWRIGPRGADIYIDKTLTPTGFAGTEGIDWKPVNKFE